jgi:hypothetical protein
MSRHLRLVMLGTVILGTSMGCQSNPFRPTSYNRSDPVGPELTMPPGSEGPYVGGDGSGGYPMQPAPPNGYYPQPGTFPPNAAPPPVQGFPQTMPPAPGQLPQGPPPKSTPITNGTSR